MQINFKRKTKRKIIDAKTNEILEQTEHDGYVGKEYNITAKEFEGYDIDKTPHRIYVTGEEIIIDFVDAKVDTGDIPVIALAVLGVICVAGIAFVVVRKVKSSKKA